MGWSSGCYLWEDIDLEKLALGDDRLVVVYHSLMELFLRETVIVLASVLDKVIGQYLRNLCAVDGSIGIDPPFV